MRQLMGALVALTVLLGLVVGPVYLAVSADDRTPPDANLCADGDVACEMGATRRASAE